MGTSKLIYSIILTLMPISELRIGLPLAINYAKESGIPIALIFFLIVLINIFLIFVIFFLLDNLHKILINFNIYKKIFNFYLKKIQKKVDKFEKSYQKTGFFALMIFVAIPLPGTGAWSGCLISWILGLERRKSIMAIAAGIMIAGILILLGTLGIYSMKIFYTGR